MSFFYVYFGFSGVLLKRPQGGAQSFLSLKQNKVLMNFKKVIITKLTSL
jgi:hypothetical protein